jgi:hypothetical protein
MGSASGHDGAPQQNRPADVRFSFASDQCSQQHRRVSALPPIAAEVRERRKLTLTAT